MFSIEMLKCFWVFSSGCQVPPAARPDPVRQGDVQEDGRRQVGGHPLRGSPGDNFNCLFFEGEPFKSGKVLGVVNKIRGRVQGPGGCDILYFC